MEIYCLRCKEKTTTKSPKKVTMENGMNSVQGICSGCGGKVSVITGKSNKAVTRNSSDKPAKVAAASTKRPQALEYNVDSANMLIKKLKKDPLAKHHGEIAWLKGFITGCQETGPGSAMYNPSGLEREMQIQGVMKSVNPKAPKSVETDPFAVRKPRSKAK